MEVFTVQALCLILLLTQICNSKSSLWYKDMDTLFSDETYEYTDPVANSWWDKVRTGCGGGRLYIPETLAIPSRVKDLMNRNQPYWIGAVEYSAWRWTDGTPLYIYTGFKYIRQNMASTKTLNDNSAFKCHLHCRKYQNVIGLRGRECYCLSETAQERSAESEIRCPGNYEEKCGNKEGMSLYKMENITMELKQNGQCVYAELSLGLDGYSINFHQDVSCDTERSVACGKGRDEPREGFKCQNSVCVSHTLRSWMSANRTCPLIKITNSARTDIKEAFKYSLIGSKDSKYWIGLRKTPVRRWLNGDIIPLQENETATEPLCLSVHLSESEEASFDWTSCTESLESLCVTTLSRTSTSTSTSTFNPGLKRRSTDGNYPSGMIPLTSDSNNPFPDSTDSVWTTSSFNQNILEEESYTKSTPHETSLSFMGIILGSSAAVVVLLAIILTVLVVFYRKKNCCFKRKSPPSSTVLHVSQSQAQDQRESNLYLSALHGNQDSTSFMISGHLGEESYNVLNYNHDSQRESKEIRNTYSHIRGSQNITEADYDVAVTGGSADRAQEDGTVLNGSRIRLRGRQEMSETDYNVLGQQGRLDGTDRGNHMYDHAVCSKAACTKPDDVYDHTLHNGECIEGEYNIAGQKLVRNVTGADTYNHIKQASDSNLDRDDSESTAARKDVEDPVYSNEKALESRMTDSIPECEYYNVE